MFFKIYVAFTGTHAAKEHRRWGLKYLRCVKEWCIKFQNWSFQGLEVDEYSHADTELTLKHALQILS